MKANCNIYVKKILGSRVICIYGLYMVNSIWGESGESGAPAPIWNSKTMYIPY